MNSQDLSCLAINAVIYCIVFCFFYITKKGTLGKIALGFYAIIAVACAYFAYQGAYFIPTIKMWALLYYIVISIIFMSPLLSDKCNIGEKLHINNTKMMQRICDFYIVSTIVYVVVMINPLITSIQSGAWLYRYVEMRAEDAIIHHNIIEQIVMNVASYLQLPVLLFVFYSYAHNIKYKRILIAAICPFICTLIWAIYMASRTSLVGIAILYLAAYLIFEKDLPQKFKHYAFVAFSIICSIGAIFILAVTVSRFGENESSWIADYFGDSNRVGHNMIAYTVKYSNGTWFGKQFLGVLGMSTTPYKCLVDDGSAFHPLIGMRYADFGFIGLIVYSSCVALFFKQLLSKKTLNIGIGYMLFYYFQDLFIGCLYDNTTAFSWLIVIVISIILNILTRNVKS